MHDEKQCASCRESKPLVEFHRCTAAKDGRQRYCRDCGRARKAKWVAENPDRVAATNARWRAENPGASRAATESWRARNADRYAASKRDWERRNPGRYHEDPQRKAARLAEWKAANRDRVREYQQRRRAAGYGAPISDIDLARLMDEAAGCCGICGDALDLDARWPEPLSMSVDHVVPLSRGGSHDLQNMQMAHLVCNLRKGNRAA